MRLVIRLFLLTCLTVLTAGPHVHAENEDASRYPVIQKGGRSPLDWLFGTKRQADTAPQPSSKKAYEPRRRSAPRITTTPKPLSPADPLNPTPDMPGTVPLPAVKINVLVIGDSLATLLAQGLQEIYADRPYISILKKGRDSSGLVRDDFYDWPKALRELLAGPEKPDALIIMLGSNDRQIMKDESGTHEARTERWRSLYEARIVSLLSAAREKNLPLLWVGLPIMKSERYSADMLAFNEIYRAKVSGPNLNYVDIWEAFTASEGQFAVSGPDITGETVRLRTSDGIHFTQAGARKLAFFADKELQKIIADRLATSPVSPPQSSPSPPANGDGLALAVPAPATTELPPQLRSIDSLIGIPLPESAVPTTLAPRPLSGAIQPLTVAPTSPNGILIDPARKTAGNTEANRLLQQGLPLPSRSGRVDDFRY